MELNPLIAQDVPLTGKHLIEASAGTGKTFNITRLYLRLLLEEGLSVEQILVMTFTKDATEEIRGRIGEVLRESLNNWSSLIVEDEFYQQISTKTDEKRAKSILQQALLFLDEAAIFTLHGFCKRILSQYAFNTGLSFNLDMDTDGRDLILQACQDWYRCLGKERPEQYKLLAQFWPQPLSFIQHFSSAIGKKTTIQVVDDSVIVEQFRALIRTTQADIENNKAFIIEQLIDSKKGKDKETRLAELASLELWLSELLSQITSHGSAFSLTPMPIKFFDGRRFAKAIKPQLVEIFNSANQLKDACKSINEKIAKAQAYAIVKKGLVQISSFVEENKNKLKRLTFDDLISKLAMLLEQDTTGQLAALLRTQFPVAMVDEFQDTDTQQFTILKAIYPTSLDNALYLIGDPKQAIYGFRGGDIFTYLSARTYCQHHWVMDTNWRSSEQMIAGYNRLFHGDTLDNPAQDVFGYNIPYQAVKASAKAKDKAVNYRQDKALQFVYFSPDDNSSAVKQSFRKTMSVWCANKIIELLNPSSSSEHAHHINAQDIAVLVRDGGEAQEIKNALQQAGLACVFLSNRANLWHSEQAQQLMLLLKAILFVENDRYFVAGLACGLLPYQHQQLKALQDNEAQWQALKFDFLSLRNDWHYHGFISMAIALLHQHMRVDKQDKDRILTNILHLLELLQSASQRYKQPQELLYWFEQQVNADIAESEAELRLESDEALIKIVTQHGSKGLEYPVVFVPFATRYKDPSRIGNRKVNVINYHDEQGKQQTTLGADSECINAMVEEAYAESIRLLYVAVTRAETQCYMLVCPFDNAHLSPLGLTLKWSKDEDLTQSLKRLSNDSPQAIGLSVIEQVESVTQFIEKDHTSVPEIPTFKGHIERDWWLSSFTALSRNLRHVGMSIPDRDLDQISIIKNEESATASDMRFMLTKGANAGNFLHDIFEYTDFSQDNWPETIERYFDKYPDLLTSWQPRELQQWLTEIVEAKLVNNKSYKELNSQHMMHEAEFYFPMSATVSSKLTDVLIQHRKNNHKADENIPLVQLPQYQKLKGMMHGFIDLIFEDEGKYYVCDYKSTYLGDDFQDYHYQAMLENNEKHYYDLQYLIYSLALHRQLKITLPDYQPEQHFGGVYYCYLRGISSKSTVPYSGIYHQHIKTEELEQLDKIFSGELNK